MSAPSILIFVYGTLKRGLSNHGCMAGQQFLGEAATAPLYRMVDCGGYPGMFPVTRDGRSIRGEVWSVNESGRIKLDDLEDVTQGLYALEPVTLLPPWDTGKVFTYCYRRPVTGLRDVGEEWSEP